MPKAADVVYMYFCHYTFSYYASNNYASVHYTAVCVYKVRMIW